MVKVNLPLVGQELPTIPEHLSSTQVFCGVRVTLFFALSVVFVLFILAIALSVLPRIMEFGYPFGIFKLFLTNLSNTSIKV